MIYFEDDDPGQEREERAVRDKLLTLWESLGSPDPPDLPEERLLLAGISPDEYHAWRMDIEDQKHLERDELARAAATEDQHAELRRQGLEPLPPRRTPDEVDAIERQAEERDERTRRLEGFEAEGESGWEQDFDDEP